MVNFMSGRCSLNCGLAVLKLLASFGVVGCHLNMRPTTPTGELLLHFTDSNVVLFGVLSGYFMMRSLEHAESRWGVAKKKALRLLPCYFAWTAFYLFIKFGLDIAMHGHLSERFFSVRCWFNIVFWGDAAAHLWYVISLFYVSLFLCAVSRWLFVVWPFLMVGSLACVIGGGHFSWYTMRLLAAASAGVGVYQWRNFIKNIPLVALLSILVIAIVVHICSPWRGLVVTYDIFVAVPLVIVFSRISKWFEPWVVSLATCSFGVYLVHVAIAFASGTVFRHYLSAPYAVWTVVADWVLVVVCSVIVTLLLRKSAWTEWMVK